MPPIFGSGNEEADYLIVTDAPTLEDAEIEMLYAGEFGETLSDLLRVCGIDPANTYRTTLVACPSYVVIPATDEDPERISYQPPPADTIKACHPRLNEVIYQIDPAMIITFGDLAWKSLVPTKLRGGRNRVVEVQGELYDAWIDGRERRVRYPLAPMLSLATIMGNPSTAAHAPRAVTIKYLTRFAELNASVLKGVTL